ncbi:YeeE/YedE family protein [Stappia sp. ICDLI1TA098]
MDFTTPQVMAACGFAGGAVLGLAARAGRFCAMGALEDAFLGHDTRRLKSWALAIAVALALTQVLAHAGILDLRHSIYLSRGFPWFGAILGGLMFGIGMALVGTCGFGTLARIGGGDLRALVSFLVMGISAYMAMGGITGMLRLRFVEPLTVARETGPALDDIVDRLLGIDTGPVIGLLIAAALAVWSLRGGAVLGRKRYWMSGLAVGLAITGGWLATCVLGADPFAPQRPVSFTFVRPLGETLVYLMTFSGATLDFGIGSVFGVVAGAFAGAQIRREFRWEACDDVRELRRHMVGAFLMGTGGILAFGCTVGQGLTAASTLSVSAPVTIAAIALGSRLGLQWLIEGSLTGLAERMGLSWRGGRG